MESKEEIAKERVTKRLVDEVQRIFSEGKSPHDFERQVVKVRKNG